MTNIVIVIAVTALLGFFFKAAKNSKAIITRDGEHLLSYSSQIKWASMGIVIFGLVGLTAISFKLPIDDNGDLIAIIIMYGALLLFGIYFYIEFFTVKILVSEKGIKGTSWWRGYREYSWEDVDEITYSLSTMWFKISSSKTAPLRIHALISGIDAFQKFYMKRLPEEKWFRANEVFRQDKRVNK